MKDYIALRVLEVAEYIASTGATVRECGKVFSLSKSTVHKDVCERLPQIDKHLYKQVQLVLSKNLSERHLRGGIATKNKYKKNDA